MGLRLVIGLGNPGPQYATSRHNMGFMIADALYRRDGDIPWQKLCLSVVAHLRMAGGLHVAKPMTYMNRSGYAVSALLENLAADPTELLVVVDDIDLPLGRLRLRPGGGPGTHNGLRDVCEAIGTGFARLRVGVSGPEPWGDLADYVLSDFAPAESEIVGEVITRATDCIALAATEGVSAAMNVFNQAPEEPPQDDTREPTPGSGGTQA